MSNSPAASQAAQQNQQFWKSIAKLPDEAQRSFWDAGKALSEYLDEVPDPRNLKFDTSAAPAGWPFWKQLLFYVGQGSYNESVAVIKMGQAAADGAQWLWGALQGDFNKSPTTGQVITGGVISMIPVVDQVCDVRDIIANCLNLSDPKAREETENWVSLGLTCIGFVPLFGSAVKTVGKVALRNADRLIDLLKQMEWLEKHKQSVQIAIPWGHAPIEWLRKYDWQGALRQGADKAKAAFEASKERALAAAEFAMGLVQAKLKQLAELFDLIAKKIGEVMSNLAKSIKEKIDRLLGNAKKEAGNFDATPGAPNRHGQGDKTPPPDKRPKPKLTGLQTEPNTAFFWSGKTDDIGGDRVAAQIANSRGGTTLEKVLKERGIKMPDWDPKNPASEKAWRDLSEAYAKGASGEVRVILGDTRRSGNIWESTEFPALKANSAVTRVTAIDPKTQVETVLFSR